MQEILSTSFTAIHFPQRSDVIRRLRLISFVVNDIILFVSLLIFLVWIFHIPTINNVLFGGFGVSPFSSVLFILSGCSLLFGAKRHLMSAHESMSKDAWYNTYIPVILCCITAFLGLFNFLHVTLLPSFIKIPSFSGFCFFLIGVALIPPFTRILHRFHYTQFLFFIVSGLTVFVILENVYQGFSHQVLQHIVYVPLPTALIFAFFSFGVLLRWSNRGFFGNFTLDATASVFALRLFLINLLAAPIIAFLILFFMQKMPYNMYQILTVIVVIYTGISSLLLWVNVKLLYRYELEHLLMRESLRSHNIDLTAEKEELRKKMIQTEQEKQQYIDKLNTQNMWKAAVDTVG